MTQEQFDRLPLLLTPGQCMDALGVDRGILRNLRQSNPQLALKVRGMKHWRYCKESVAEMARLRFK